MTKNHTHAVSYCLQGGMTSQQSQGSGVNEDKSFTLNSTDVHAVCYENHANDSRISGPNEVVSTVNSRWGTGGNNQDLVMFGKSIDTTGHQGDNVNAEGDAWNTLPREGGNNGGGGVLLTRSIVRRLTPVECERLQGFPDGYTDIKPNGKPTPDGVRYKALGNSMGVNVMRWIGFRIQIVEDIIKEKLP